MCMTEINQEQGADRVTREGEDLTQDVNSHRVTQERPALPLSHQVGDYT